MFGIYTQRAIHALELAAQEAQDLDSRWVHAEHLVLALLRMSEDEGAVGSSVLRRLGITEEAFRARLQEWRRRVPSDPGRDRKLQFGATMNYVLERSLQLTLDMGVVRVGTGQLLLGVLYERVSGPEVAEHTLEEHGVTYEVARELVLEEGMEEPAKVSSLPLALAPAVKKTQGATHIEEFARQRASYDEDYKGQVGTHHYLLALMQEGDLSPAHGGSEGGGLAARALRSFGLSYGVLEARVNELRGAMGSGDFGSDAPGPTPPPGPRPIMVEDPEDPSLPEEVRERLRELNRLREEDR